MATIAKFYLLDAASANTGTMPSGALQAGGSSTATTGDATGARTARNATDTPGTSNPDVESSITANADQLPQIWGHRRFVSAPLAATTFASADGNWTFSYARSESNLNHNQSIVCTVYPWRPGSGARVGTGTQCNIITGTEPTSAGAEQVESLNHAWGASVTIQDGDILVFDVVTNFTQAMSTAYTDNFAYDGTTEASTTTCATFVTPPAALTLFSGTSGSTYTKAGHGVEHG